MSRHFPSEKDDDFPLNLHGDKVTEEYWMGIEGAVNTCGDRLRDLWRDYKDYPVTDLSRLEKLSSELNTLRLRFQDIPYAVCIVVFYENLQADDDFNVFNAGISNQYWTMPENIRRTVESLRFINSKFIERKNSIASQLRGSAISGEGTK